MGHLAVSRVSDGYVVQRVTRKRVGHWHYSKPLAGPFTKKANALALKKALDHAPDQAPLEARIMLMFARWNVGRTVGEIARQLRVDEKSWTTDPSPLTGAERRRTKAAVASLILQGRLYRAADSEPVQWSHLRGREHFRMVEA